MKIELNDIEIIHIMDALRERVNDLRESHSIGGLAEEADLADELEELEHDLFEASARPNDWTEDVEPTEIVICDAETRMFNAGIQAREQVKESSRASIRRAKRFGEFDVNRPDRKLSETQMIDLWERPNDPTKW